MGSKGEAFFRIFQSYCFGLVPGVRREKTERIAPEMGQLMVSFDLLLFDSAAGDSVFKCADMADLFGSMVSVDRSPGAGILVRLAAGPGVCLGGTVRA